jgi:serine/threonine protein kinase
MSDYQIVDGHVIFTKLFSDTLGENSRAAVLENRKADRHKLLCRVDPLIAGNPDVWKRVKILLEGIRKSNIVRLYTPEKIIAGDNQALLIYDHFRGKNLEQVLKDAEEKGMPINFDLAFSIAVAIADIIELGSSIVVSGEKSYHGFLTPDNILIDTEGKIFLKNYGLFQYLEKNEAFYSQMETRYGPWLTPELMRHERIVAQSDIYHLGFILYHILTGKYFQATTVEGFDGKFANLTFKQYIPSTDKDFLTHLITFFKKTLHPDPLKRFLSIKELKEYISNYFHIEELSSITFNLAYFMNSLYSESAEEEEKTLKQELAFVVPEPKKERSAPLFDSSKPDSEIVSNILQGLDEEKKSRSWIWAVVGVAALVVVFSVFMYLNSVKTRRNAEAATQAEKLRAQQAIAQQENQQKQQQALLEEKLRASEQAKKSLEDQIKKTQNEQDKQRLIQQKQEAEKKAEEDKQRLEKMKADEAAAQAEELRKAEAEKQKALDEEKRKQDEAKKVAEQLRIKEGDTVASSDLTVKPEKISGNAPTANWALNNKYKGKALTVTSSVFIDETGNVVRVKFLGSVPDDIRDLVEAALLKWKYKPGQKDGVRVKVWMPIPIRFNF